MPTEIKKYIKTLERKLQDRKNPSIEFNGDSSHNAAVMIVMLNYSENNNVGINMFCGSLSVLRSSFFDKMGSEVGKDTRVFLQKKMEESLTSYFKSKDNKLKVVLEQKPKDSDEYLDGFIFPIRDYIKKGKIEISYLREELTMRGSLDHFSYIADGSMGRLEYDKHNHAALCAFHREGSKKGFDSMFEDVLSAASPLSL